MGRNVAISSLVVAGRRHRLPSSLSPAEMSRFRPQLSLVGVTVYQVLSLRQNVAMISFLLVAGRRHRLPSSLSSTEMSPFRPQLSLVGATVYQVLSLRRKCCDFVLSCCWSAPSFTKFSLSGRNLAISSLLVAGRRHRLQSSLSPAEMSRFRPYLSLVSAIVYLILCLYMDRVREPRTFTPRTENLKVTIGRASARSNLPHSTISEVQSDHDDSNSIRLIYRQSWFADFAYSHHLCLSLVYVCV